MNADVVPALPVPRVPVRGGGTFPVHRIYCIGRNFAEHGRAHEHAEGNQHQQHGQAEYAEQYAQQPMARLARRGGTEERMAELHRWRAQSWRWGSEYPDWPRRDCKDFVKRCTRTRPPAPR